LARRWRKSLKTRLINDEVCGDSAISEKNSALSESGGGDCDDCDKLSMLVIYEINEMLRGKNC
jgi:hypothetical protein